MSKDKKDKKEEELKEEEDLKDYLPDKRNKMGIIALILSLITVALSLTIFIYYSYITGIIALILGIIAFKTRYKKTRSVLAIIISLIAMIWVSTQCPFVTDLYYNVKEKQSKTTIATGKYTREEVKKYVNVTLGEFKVKTDKRDHQTTELIVTIKNTSDQTLTGNVHIKVKDEKDKVIGNDQAYFNNLKKGKTTKVKVFTYVDKDKIESFKKAKFIIKEISLY